MNAGVSTEASDNAPLDPSVSATSPEQLQWAPGASQAKRKRHIFVATQLLGVALISLLALAGAFLMHRGWPASLGQVRTSPYDILPIMQNVFRVLVAPEFRYLLPLALVSIVVHVELYRRLRLHHQASGPIAPFRQMRDLAKVSIAGGVVLYVTASGFGGVQLGEGAHHDAVFFTYQSALVFFGLGLFRSGALSTLFLFRCLGIGQTRIALVAGRDVAALRETLSRPGSEYRFVGLIATGTEPPAEGSPWIGNVAQLESIINRHYVDEVLLAVDPSELTVPQRLHVAHSCWRLGADLKMVTPFHPYFYTAPTPELMGDVPVLRVERSGLYRTRAQIVKRALDIVVSATALVVLAPVMILVAILIRLESEGAVLFVQERPGLHGRVFRILKFRSMYSTADTVLHREAQRRLIREGKPAGLDKNGRPIFGKVANDPRVTHVGKWIRRTSIDELPQLINVLRGEMSLVGPRPAVLSDVGDFKEWHLRRHAIRPGITGLWQVSGRSRLSFDQMVELDIKYIEQWSLWLDIKILLKTAAAVLKLGDAY